LQRFAKVADQSAPKRLVNLMFLKGSFYFPSRSNMGNYVRKGLIDMAAKPCGARLPAGFALLWFLQKNARKDQSGKRP
jgi:hypothetical protein